MALVVDWEKSERGPQRRRAPGQYGRLLHCCCICGKLDIWGRGWSMYCSEGELDDCVPVPKFCSYVCQRKGGSKASNVTAEMKQKAKDAEWREPERAYREQTAREKYDDAADVQRRSLQRRQPPSTDTGSVT